MHRYYMARAHGNMMASAPPELVEIGLMEKFGWLPQEIDEIPLGRMQRIFVAMEQREQDRLAVNEIESRKQKKR